jgi:hypothetical protein
MSNVITHRLVAIAAHWSFDHICDLSPEERRRPVPRSAPGSHTILLSAEFGGLPAPEEVAAALALTHGVAEGYEGRAVLRSYALLSPEAWAAFLAWEGPDVEDRMRRSEGEASPPIALFVKLAHARRALGTGTAIIALPGHSPRT